MADPCVLSAAPHAGRLPAPGELRRELPLDTGVATDIGRWRGDIARIIGQPDQRRLVIAGPCSIHDADSAMEYAERLQRMQHRLGDAVLLVMRCHVEKPRTALAWNGLVHDPRLDGSGDLVHGIRLARKLMLRIAALVPVATEFIEPYVAAVLHDLVSWMTVGARTVESPLYRKMAAMLPCPVGFKNSTSGRLDSAIAAMMVAGAAQPVLAVDDEGGMSLHRAPGNPAVHLVLRGGDTGSNADAESVMAASRHLAEAGLPGRVLLDAGHGNSDGTLAGLRSSAARTIQLARSRPDLVSGVMIESNLVSGRQPHRIGVPVRPGLSITDNCIGFDELAGLIALV